MQLDVSREILPLSLEFFFLVRESGVGFRLNLIILKIERRCSFTDEIKNIKKRFFLLTIFRVVSPSSGNLFLMFFISSMKLHLLSIFNNWLYHTNNTPIEQLSRINYLGVEISSLRNVEDEVKSQVVKGERISGCLYSLIWKNKWLSPEGKVRIYKTCVR